MTDKSQDSARTYSLVKFECRCGRCFYMAMSTEVPALFTLAGGPDEAVDALFAKLPPGRLGDIVKIPDFLPPDL